MKLANIIVLTLGIGLTMVSTTVAEIKLNGKYKIVQVEVPKFKVGLEMIGHEQNEYARHLTRFAVSRIIEERGAQLALDNARRFIGLALHLSPKNREAVVANVQLSRGIVPQIKRKVYNNLTFSTLLFARAKLLRKAEGELNVLLAQAFTAIAADLNPTNEDLVYEAVMLEQDIGKLDWKQFTGDE